MRDDDPREQEKAYKEVSYANQAAIQRVESHLVYEIKQQREYHIRKLIDIQKAIDAINQI